MHQTFARTYPDGVKGTYTAAPGSELPLALATLKPYRLKRKGEKRLYPAYVRGITSTRDYVSAYFSLNTRPHGKINAYANHLDQLSLYAPLRDEPAHGYMGIDTIESEEA
jgi:hypothetical protein